MKILESRERDLGGFFVRRLLPTAEIKKVGPFIFFDHLGPASFEPGNGLDVRPHPHINLATITYLFEGIITHKDSLGIIQDITAGAINLMVAGKGIVHSERTPDSLRLKGHNVHALQLWMALPEEFEEIDPEFHHYPETEIPKKSNSGVSVRVMMGEYQGMKSPVKTFMQTLYLECEVDENSLLKLFSAVKEKAIYVVSGVVEVSGMELDAHNMLILPDNYEGDIKALSTKAKFVVIGGASLSRRYVDWNFVSSSKARIEKAKLDWKQGNFPKVPGETEFIPLPE